MWRLYGEFKKEKKTRNGETRIKEINPDAELYSIEVLDEENKDQIIECKLHENKKPKRDKIPESVAGFMFKYNNLIWK